MAAVKGKEGPRCHHGCSEGRGPALRLERHGRRVVGSLLLTPAGAQGSREGESRLWERGSGRETSRERSGWGRGVSCMTTPSSGDDRGRRLWGGGVGVAGRWKLGLVAEPGNRGEEEPAGRHHPPHSSSNHPPARQSAGANLASPPTVLHALSANGASSPSAEWMRQKTGKRERMSTKGKRAKRKEGEKENVCKEQKNNTIWPKKRAVRGGGHGGRSGETRKKREETKTQSGRNRGNIGAHHCRNEIAVELR